MTHLDRVNVVRRVPPGMIVIAVVFASLLIGLTVWLIVAVHAS